MLEKKEAGLCLLFVGPEKCGVRRVWCVFILGQVGFHYHVACVVWGWSGFITCRGPGVEFVPPRGQHVRGGFRFGILCKRGKQSVVFLNK